MGAKASGEKGGWWEGSCCSNTTTHMFGNNNPNYAPTPQECVRVLAQLPLPSCPVAEVALQQLLPKILGYLRKALQVWDMTVLHSTMAAGTCANDSAA